MFGLSKTLGGRLFHIATVLGKNSGIFLHVIDAAQEGSRHQRIMIRTINRRVANQFFSGKPEGPFFLSCTLIFRNENNWMKKSARVSEKLISPVLPGLQVASPPDRHGRLRSHRSADA